MINFNATIEKFGSQGEKTGWTYIKIDAALAQQLQPGNKKSFRVKGLLDEVSIQQVALIPMGDGHFILPLNATLRRSLGKQKGAIVRVQIKSDHSQLMPSADLVACLAEEPEALHRFQQMPASHQHYYTKWLETAKTEPTKTKRIAMIVNAMCNGWDFAQMLRAEKAKKDLLR